jgi:segregation and condensation protein A
VTSPVVTSPVADGAIATVEGPAADRWEDPPRRPPETTAPVLAVDGFEGPLDWLLAMARTRKLDLARLSILALVDAFGEALRAALTPGLPAAGLARWAGWTVMAAQLAELRSRLMLPREAPGAQAARAEAEALRRRWISHAQMRAAADWLDRRPQLGRDVFARGRAEAGRAGQGAGRRRALAADDEAADDAEASEGSDAAGRDDLTALLRACLVALRLPPHAAQTYQPRQLPFWTVTDAIARITRLLPAQTEPVSLDRFLPEDPMNGQALRRKAALAATLIAGLELARGGTLTLDQDALWQPILVA